MTVRIKVDEDDINDGLPSCPRECPLAVAIKRHCKKEVAVGVTGGYFSFTIDEPPYTNYRREEVELDEGHSPAYEFVVLFDKTNGRMGEPFEFDLDIPEWALK
jgi:hypothetical protein